MGFSLSGGPYQYNRFDIYESQASENEFDAYQAETGEDISMDEWRKQKSKKKSTADRMSAAYDKRMNEGAGASNPQKMKAAVDKAGVKTRKQSKDLTKASKGQEAKQEVGSADGDMVEGFKPLPKEKMARQQQAAYGKEQRAVAAGDEKEVNKQMNRRNAMSMPASRKVQLMNKKEQKEELNNDETTETVMENRMAMYSRALGVMGAHYSGPGFGVSSLEEKKKDDEPTSERKSAADRADEEKRQKKEGKYGEAEETEEIEKNEDEDMKDGRPWLKGKKSEKKEEVILTKDDVVQYLVDEGYANNEVSAEILHTHVSDEFLEQIESRMLDEGLEKFRKAQRDRAANRKDPDEEEVRIKDETPPTFNKTDGPVKKLKPRKARKGEGFGAGSRKRQGAGKPDSAGRGGPVQFQ